MFAIRPFDGSDADYAALVDILNVVWPTQPASVTFERRSDNERNPALLFRRLLVELDADSAEPGRCVAAADYGHIPWAYHPQKFIFNIQVHPDFRRQGIGGALYTAIFEALTPYEPVALESGTREDLQAGIQFLTSRGYKPVMRFPTSELDPAGFDPAPFAGRLAAVAAAGIEIKTLAELMASEPQAMLKLYMLHQQAERDAPWHGETTPVSLEQWCKTYHDNPDLLLDGYLVAVDKGDYVGVSHLWGSQATDAILYTGFTGVLRAYRRRGIATALKVRAIEYARTRRTAEGRPPVIRTGNEENNPMLQLNHQLGFVEQPAWLAFVQPMTPAGDPPPSKPTESRTPAFEPELSDHKGVFTMANILRKKGVIAILTGGGDVPGLNPAIRAVTIRAIREGYQVVGLRRGWAGVVEIVRDRDADNSNNYQILTEELVNRAGRTGGTFLHTSRTRPSHIAQDSVPEHLKDKYTDDVNDLTEEVIKNLDFLGVDYLIPIGGDDTLSYGVHLYRHGIKVVAIPKTMDNDVPGTDYCIGFSTCVTRTIAMTNILRTSAGSHERFLVLEVFGRYAGFTAMLPTMAGAANRCVIPEYRFDIRRLTELLAEDRRKNPSRYAVTLVSEGAMFEGGEMVFQDQVRDAYGHAKLGGIGDLVSSELKRISPEFNNGKPINTITQKLGYLVRGGDPDAIDSVVPMAYGNLALDLILKGIHGRLVVLKNGRYDDMPVDVVTSTKKLVNIAKHYNSDRLRPLYKSFEMQPLFIMTSE